MVGKREKEREKREREKEKREREREKREREKREREKKNGTTKKNEKIDRNFVPSSDKKHQHQINKCRLND